MKEKSEKTMLKDPRTRWHGTFPYDALAAAGVTPHSSMREILDASFDLMAQGSMSPELCAAWDQLRIAERRLVVDFFLYPPELSGEHAGGESRQDPSRLGAGRRVPPSFPAAATGDLEAMDQDFRPITARPPEIRLPPEPDQLPPLPGPELVEFDR